MVAGLVLYAAGASCVIAGWSRRGCRSRSVLRNRRGGSSFVFFLRWNQDWFQRNAPA